jgi:hypothetical protein
MISTTLDNTHKQQLELQYSVKLEDSEKMSDKAIGGEGRFGGERDREGRA